MIATVCIPTRGDVDLTPILDTIPDRWPVIVYDNSQRDDVGVYGRYIACAEARTPVVVTQDDDCLIDLERVVAAYEPGRLVANMPESRWADYPDSALVGWGAVFDRDLPETAFAEYAPVGLDADNVAELSHFYRTCDVVFSALTPRTIIDVGFQHLPWAETPGRMFLQPGHKQERDRMLELCRRVRGAGDDHRIAA